MLRQKGKPGSTAVVRAGVAGAFLFGVTAWLYLDRLSALGSAHPDHWGLWPFVALGVWAGEHKPVKLNNRRVNLSIGFGDLPALAGIVYLSPLLVLSAVFTGSLAAHVTLKRSPSRALLGLGEYTLALGAGIAFYYHFLAGATPVSTRGWLVVGATLLFVAAVNTVVTLATASFQELHWWVPPPRLALYSSASLAACYVGAMMAVLLISVNPWTVLLFSLMAAGVQRAFEGTRETHGRYVGVAKLYDLSKDLIPMTSTREVMSEALARACWLAHADRAEVVLPVRSAVGQLAVRCSLERGGGPRYDEEDGLSPRDLLVSAALPFRGGALAEAAPRGGASGDAADEDAVALIGALETQGFAGAMAASLEPGKKDCGYLLVSDPAYHNYSFTEADQGFLEALAATVGVALRSSELMENLRRELATRQYQAQHDPLTGLPNREKFLGGLDHVLRSQPEAAVAALLVNLYGFKEVNDTLGHLTGDAVLVEVARRLQELGAPGRSLVPWPALPSGAAEVGTPAWFDGDGTSFWRRVVKAPSEEPASRFGGDEFALFLVRPDPDLLERACNAVEGIVARTCEVESLPLDLRASVGVAMVAPGRNRRDAKNLMRRAEVAMYLAKDAGGGTRFYTPAEEQASARRMAVASELRRALSSGGLDVWYQPRVELATGQLVGCEALLRWHHERLGPVSPVEFVPVAEDAGLIDPITWWALDRSLSELARWREHLPAFTVSVNLSARSLSTAPVVEQVADALARHGLPPAALTLELTESSVTSDALRSEETMSELSALGVNLAIDDYGTGFSSLSRLQRLPFDDLKIDRSFVKDLVSDRGGETIVRTTIELAKNLGRTVTAEGVEDKETLVRLAGLGCDAAQGFYLSRPLPTEQFEAWVEAWPEEQAGRMGTPDPRLAASARL